MIFDGISSNQVMATHKLITLLRRLKLAGLPIIRTKKASNAANLNSNPPYRIVYEDYIDDLDIVDLEDELYDFLFNCGDTDQP